MERVVLDTCVYLGMFYGDKDDCNRFRYYLLYKENNLFVVICDGVKKELFRKMSEKHLAFNTLYQNIIIPLVIKNKINENGLESKLPENCNVSHKNDAHIIECALGSNCEKIITLDSRLQIDGNCNVKIVDITEYINQNS